MKFKVIIETLKKRVVLIPLGTLAALATIISVVSQFIPSKESEIDRILKEYIVLKTKLDRYNVPDSIVASDSTLQLIESIQDNIELYIRSVSKIQHESTKHADKNTRCMICRQNLMILYDSESTSQSCRRNLMQLFCTDDSIMQKDLSQYISIDKLNDNLEASSEFTNYLSIKGSEIESLDEPDEVLAKIDEILTSKELSKNLKANKEYYTDLYDSLNILKRKYLMK